MFHEFQPIGGVAAMMPGVDASAPPEPDPNPGPDERLPDDDPGADPESDPAADALAELELEADGDPPRFDVDPDAAPELDADPDPAPEALPSRAEDPELPESEDERAIGSAPGVPPDSPGSPDRGARPEQPLSATAPRSPMTTAE